MWLWTIHIWSWWNSVEANYCFIHFYSYHIFYISRWPLGPDKHIASGKTKTVGWKRALMGKIGRQSAIKSCSQSAECCSSSPDLACYWTLSRVFSPPTFDRSICAPPPYWDTKSPKSICGPSPGLSNDSTGTHTHTHHLPCSLSRQMM